MILGSLKNILFKSEDLCTIFSAFDVSYNYVSNESFQLTKAQCSFYMLPQLFKLIVSKMSNEQKHQGNSLNKISSASPLTQLLSGTNANAQLSSERLSTLISDFAKRFKNSGQQQLESTQKNRQFQPSNEELNGTGAIMQTDSAMASSQGLGQILRPSSVTLRGSDELADSSLPAPSKILSRPGNQKFSSSNYIQALKQHFFKNTIMQTANAPNLQQMAGEISAESQSDVNPKIVQLAKFFAAQLTEDGKSDPSTQRQEDQKTLSNPMTALDDLRLAEFQPASIESHKPEMKTNPSNQMGMQSNALPPITSIEADKNGAVSPGSMLRVGTTIIDSQSFKGFYMDPFQKQVEKVLSHQSLSNQSLDAYIRADHVQINHAMQGMPPELQKILRSMNFLVKFKGISHMHCQWLPGLRIVVNCDENSLLALLEYIMQQFCLKKPNIENQNALSSQLARGSNADAQGQLGFNRKPNTQNLNDVMQCRVEMVLSTAKLFPLIHRSVLPMIMDTWREECSRILDLLINISHENICFGLKFTEFDPILKKEQVEEKRAMIEMYLESPVDVLNLTQLQNKLFNRDLKGPYEFWTCLGKIFKTIIIFEEDEQTPIRQFCAILRTLSLSLFNKWKVECGESYKMFKSRQQAVSAHNKFGNKDQLDKQSQSIPSDDSEINLRDLMICSKILRQNEEILHIQKTLGSGKGEMLQETDTSQMQGILSLFIENQKLLQNLMVNLKVTNSQVKKYEQDLRQAKKQKIAQTDETLIDLRGNLLKQNSHQMIKLQESSSRTLKQQIKLQSDTSNSFKSEPLFLFHLYKSIQQSEKSSSFKNPTDEQHAILSENQKNLGQNQQSPSNIFSLDAVVNEEANRNNSQKPEKALVKSLQHNIERFLAQANGQDFGDSQEDMLKQQSKQSNSIPSNPNNEAVLSKPTTNFTSNQNQGSNRTKLPNLKYFTDSDFSIVSKSKTNSKEKKNLQIKGRHKPTITEMFNIFKSSNPDNKQGNTKLQDCQAEPAGEENELFWLLFVGESMQEIIANPYLFEGDVQALIDGLFKKDSLLERDSFNSIDMKHYYLRQKAQREPTKLSVSENIISEPLFLVKWEGLSFADVTWEPLSALQGQNLKKVHEFIDSKHRLSLQQRQIMAEQVKLQSQLMRLNQQLIQNINEKLSYAKIFKVEKELMSQFIQTTQQSEMQSMDRNSDDIAAQTRGSFRLSNLQKQSLAYLSEAFQNNQNMLLLDQRGLGKRVTLTFFLQSLKEQQHLNGPFLIITSQSKLSEWNRLISQLTSLQPLVYHDTNMKEGMENLRRWCLYCFDVTIKGNLTVRNQSNKFNVLITTPEVIQDENDPEIRKIPFMQVIVDEADIESHREATKHITCKRIICSTSNPIPNTLTDAFDLVQVIDPMPFVTTDLKGITCKISSFDQLENMWTIMSRYTCKHFQVGVENLYGKMNQIEIDVQMTPAQLTIYNSIFLRYQKLLSQLCIDKNLDQIQQAKIEKVEKLLLQACQSVFLIDKEEQLFDQCKQIIQLNKKDLKISLRQQLVSGKMAVIQQIVAKLKMTTNKAIICTHYPHMIVLLKKVFKELGIACFNHQLPKSMDSVFRFNLYNERAVFLFQIGQTWTKEECSMFDLDLVQNIIFFDQEGPLRNDLVSLFKVCNLPYSVNLTVYRLIAANSFEQKLYKRKKGKQLLQSLLFDQSNPWKQQRSNLSQLKLSNPVEISTKEECNPHLSTSLIPTSELDLLMKLSTEPIVSAQSKFQNLTTPTMLCPAEIFQTALLEQDLETPELENLIKQANRADKESNLSKIERAYVLCKSLEESELTQMPNLKSADFYSKALGLQTTQPLQHCNHQLCDSLLSIANLSGQQSDSNDSTTKHSYVKLNEIYENLGKQHVTNMQKNMDMWRFTKRRTEKEKGIRTVESENGQIMYRYNNKNRDWNNHNSKLQNLINNERNQDNHHIGKKTMDMGTISNRKPLSEEDRQDSPRAGEDKMDFHVINRHAQASEDNTIQKPFGSEDKMVQSIDQSPVLSHKNAGKIVFKEEIKLNQTQRLIQTSDYEQNMHTGNIPDKMLPNGKICQHCFMAIPCDKNSNSLASNGPIYNCIGPCKKTYHSECATQINIMIPNSLQRSSERQSIKGRPSTDSAQGKDGPSEQTQQENGDEYNFLCKNCNNNETQCFICKKYGEIYDQNQLKIGKPAQQEGQSSENPNSNRVEKCIVGPCSKFYHVKCLQNNQNVDFYTNNRNQSRFRCPLHYCGGCSISGNSVQILQCTACPTSYHLKCFRADRGAMKLTRKFILCGKHEDLKKDMQVRQKSRSRQVKTSTYDRRLTSGPSLESGAYESGEAKQNKGIITLSGKKMTMEKRLQNQNGHFNDPMRIIGQVAGKDEGLEQSATEIFSQKLLAIKEEMQKRGGNQNTQNQSRQTFQQESRQDKRNRDVKDSMKTYIRINTALNKHGKK